MTLETFIREVEYEMIHRLEFYVLEKPEIVTAHRSLILPSTREFFVLALAISSSSRYEKRFMFALAIERFGAVRNFRLTVLSKFMSDSGDEQWVEARKILFHGWAHVWIQSHQEQLVEIGFNLGLAFAESDLSSRMKE